MKINFNAGPAALPVSVLEEASRAILEYADSGMSVLGLPHRGAHFKAMLQEARELVLNMLELDAETYEVMWFQGGGRLQFEMIPMNFMPEGATAAYVLSGRWAADAVRNASRYGRVHIAASSESTDYDRVPEDWDIPSEACYVHLTANNTIYGTQSFHFPETTVPLIADFSSELFSRRLDYSRFDLIYAVAQKNIGPAGVTLVVARKSFIRNTVRPLPDILSYAAMAAQNSLINTAPVFAIYTSLLYLRWIAAKGMAQVEAESEEKARLLYAYLDQSTLLLPVADRGSRSRMNVCCRLREQQDTDALLQYAESRNITGIAGHRSVGGLRISLYNAISIADVHYLISVLQDFERMKERN